MKNNNLDKIEYGNKQVVHQSAGGFVFFEDVNSKLYVAVLQKEDGKYLIPKGHIKEGESNSQAASREIREELNLNTKFEELCGLGVDQYSFLLPGDKRTHIKHLYLYVFQASEKSILKPLKNEGFVKAEWLIFEKASEKLFYDKKNLLKARDVYYKYKSKNG